MIKRLFDIIFSLLGLILLAPLLFFLSFVIKFSSKGSVFFKQTRVGRNGKHFTMIKFRSMLENSEKKGSISIKGDDRITTIGSILRKYKLDELPELWNVLMGDMSLVGPRPYLKAHDHLFQKSYKSYRIRQFVKPGVTGPAQCRGLRGEFTDDALVSKRIELDFAYVGSWSIWTDMIIILRTVGQVLFPPKSAY